MKQIAQMASFFRNKQSLLKIVTGNTINCDYSKKDRKFHAISGSIKAIDAYYISKLIKKHKPKTILEVGSFLGFSTNWLLKVSKDWNAKVTAIDPNIRHRIFDTPRTVVEKLNSEYLSNRLEIISGFLGEYSDGIYFDYEHYNPIKDRDSVNNIVKKRIKIDESWNKKFDFIFIDGDHSYLSVIKDFRICKNFLNPNGIIAFHDAIAWADVNKAVYELKNTYNQQAEVYIMGESHPRLAKRSLLDGIGVFELK